MQLGDDAAVVQQVRSGHVAVFIADEKCHHAGDLNGLADAAECAHAAEIFGLGSAFGGIRNDQAFQRFQERWGSHARRGHVKSAL